MQAAVREVAALIGAEPADVVALANATSAVNIVVNSMDLCQGDLLLMTSITYPAVRSCNLPRSCCPTPATRMHCWHWVMASP